MSDEQPQSPEVQARIQKRLKKIKAYQDLFNSPTGAAVLADMMRVHGVLSAHPADPQSMAIKEGERAVVLRIMTFLQINPTELRERISDETV